MLDAIGFLTDFIKENVGSLVKKEHYNARKKICNACEMQVMVEPVPMLILPGCGICKCPTLTKPRCLTHYSQEAGEVIKTVCPHPDGNKWEEVDEQFLNKK